VAAECGSSGNTQRKRRGVLEKRQNFLQSFNSVMLEVGCEEIKVV
jgi:hypothetical protein